MKNAIDNVIKDELGGVYSLDGKRLLQVDEVFHTRTGNKDSSNLPISIFRVFSGATDGNEYKVKDGTVVICDSAFRNRSSVFILDCFEKPSTLTKVVLPNSVTTIGNYAFCDCYSLESIVLPKSLKIIGDGAFSHCSA